MLQQILTHIHKDFDPGQFVQQHEQLEPQKINRQKPQNTENVQQKDASKVSDGMQWSTDFTLDHTVYSYVQADSCYIQTHAKP